MHFTYILYSPQRDRTYVGSSGDWEARLAAHNSGRVAATRSGIPWRVVLTEGHETYAAARHRERYLKSSAGRRWMKKMLGTLADKTPARPA